MCINCSDDVTYGRLFRLYAPRKSSSSARLVELRLPAPCSFAIRTDGRTEGRGEEGGAAAEIAVRDGGASAPARSSLDPDLDLTTHLVAH